VVFWIFLALETVGAAAEVVVEVAAEVVLAAGAADVVEEVLAALLTGAVGVSFLAQAAAKHTTPAITATRMSDEDCRDLSDMMQLLLECETPRLNQAESAVNL
jgi:hypothetical protein